MGRTPHDDPAPGVDAYRERIRAHLAGLTGRGESGAEQVPLADCAGRVTAAPVTAPVDLPLFRNSQMDGYAVHAADVADASSDRPVTLPVARVIAAGQPPGVRLEPGNAVKIMTGAALPEGAGCVIPVEDTSPDGPVDGATVRIHAPRDEGTFVRSPGDDVRVGDLVFEAGTVLGARQLAAAASLGLATLAVRPRPRVAVLSTGSELVPAGATPGPGEIWDSNSISLATAVREAGGVVTMCRVTGDDPADFAAALDEAAAASDVVLTSGAVSMGDFEVVRDTLERTPDAWFGHIAMQPGGPQGLASWNGVPIVCLPGNPVSVLVSFVVLLRGVLADASGTSAATSTAPGVGSTDAVPLAADALPLAADALPLAETVNSPPGRTQFLRVTVADGVATPLSGPGSHLVATMGRADALAEIPAATTESAAGSTVRVWPL